MSLLQALAAILVASAVAGFVLALIQLAADAEAAIGAARRDVPR